MIRICLIYNLVILFYRNNIGVAMADMYRAGVCLRLHRGIYCNLRSDMIQHHFHLMVIHHL